MLILILLGVVLISSPAKAVVEFVDSFSDFTSSDVTITSSEDIDGKIVFESADTKGIIDSQTVPLKVKANQTISKVIIWEKKPSNDQYTVKASVYNGNIKIIEKSMQVSIFSAGMPSYRVVDLAASNTGVELLLDGISSSIVDLKIDIIDNNDIIFTTTKSNMILNKDITNGLKIDWPFTLKDNNKYNIRAKVYLRNIFGTPPVVTSYISSFVATNDVEIIPQEVKVDEYGASITLRGKSQVPFDGSIDIIAKSLTTNQTQTYRQEVAKILISGTEDTTGVVWKGLKPGKYQIDIRAMTNDNVSVAEYKTVLRVPNKPIESSSSSDPATEEQSGLKLPGFQVLYLIIGFGIALIIRKMIEK